MLDAMGKRSSGLPQGAQGLLVSVELICLVEPESLWLAERLRLSFVCAWGDVARLLYWDACVSARGIRGPLTSLGLEVPQRYQ